MSEIEQFELRPIGSVRSELTDPDDAPKQGDEGAPDAWLEFDPGYSAALADIQPGDDVFVLTWFHLARRDKQQVRPRSDPNNPITGVFSTRSPDRPNPLGLHKVTVLAVDGVRLRVNEMEAIDGTPVVDIKPVLDGGAR